MTVVSQESSVVHNGNGVTKVFPIPFRFFKNTDLFVYLYDTTTNLSVPLALDVDYTLTGAGNPTADGNLTTVATYAAGKQISVIRDMPVQQLTDIVNQGPFFPEIHENVFDRLTMMIQDIGTAGGNAIRFPASEQGFLSVTPLSGLRADKVMAFDNVGNVIVSDLTLDQIEAGATVGNSSRGTKTITATAGQTLLTTDYVYVQNANQIAVSVNGLLLTPAQDYVETSPTTVTLNDPLEAGDVVLIEAFSGTSYSVDAVNVGFAGGNLADLTNNTDPAKGAALIGRNIQVVGSFVELRELSGGSPSDFAYVQGNINGIYIYAPNDNTTPDNGWTAIVANDGGRWFRQTRIIQPQSTATDFAVFRLDRTANHVGGVDGTVNSCLRTQTTVSQDVDNFEWVHTSVLNNNADDGQNVAIYGQGNKLGFGPTWAGVFEARDKTNSPNPVKGLVGLEVDVFANGTDSTLQRIGIDIVSGKGTAGGAQCHAGHGIRIGPVFGDITEGRYTNGITMTGTMTNGINMQTSGSFGIVMTGTKNVGIDLSGGTHSISAIRIGFGQKFSFDGTDARVLYSAAGRLAYDANASRVFEVLDTGQLNAFGIITVSGTQVITSRRTGYTNAMTGTANRATAYSTSTITLIQLAERVKALQDDLSTHGLIGV